MMTSSVKSPRKLIEVALPLNVINEASVREGYIYRGNPSSLHKWWAQRPLAAARAVLFAQLVNDPGYQQDAGFKYGKNKKEATEERKRLFKIIEDLVKWENLNNKDVISVANIEIMKSWREICELNRDNSDAEIDFDPSNPPSIYDPFSGGCSIPLEGQRLGMKVIASDLNPVAVLINKAMIEIPSKFLSLAPIGPIITEGMNIPFIDNWYGALGLAEDVRRYGKWMYDEAMNRIGSIYQPITITSEMVSNRPELNYCIGQKYKAIGWIWARTVKSPNPAFSHVEVPLAGTFVVSSKVDREVFVQPVINEDKYKFIINQGTPTLEIKQGTRAKGGRGNFICIVSGSAISTDYIRGEAQAGRMGQKLLAVVTEVGGRRIYFSPTSEIENVATKIEPTWIPSIEFFQQALGFRIGNYGMSKWSDLYTKRQLVALSCLTDLISEARKMIQKDAENAGFIADNISLVDNGHGSRAYAEAIGVYLAFAINKHAMYGNSLVPWYSKEDRPSMLFTQQTVPMVWDFIELNPFSDIGGSFLKSLQIVAGALEGLPQKSIPGVAFQQSATDIGGDKKYIFSTDPPYYDNVGYADLSDFFYVWLRHSQKDIFPNLFSTLSVPKSEELVATPARHGGVIQAEKFFLDGMTSAMQSIARHNHPAFPVTIYYAFKQSDTAKNDETSSTGWVTFLEAVIQAGFVICGTWPIHTERSGRMRDNDSNALASSIILVCRKRENSAQIISRRDYIRELNQVLPAALDEMTRGTTDGRSPVAPVDLSQAIIGPGMAAFSKYAAVLEADGSSMGVRTALQLINRFLAEDDFDAETQFCMHWFEQFGWKTCAFGQADVLARSKATSVEGLAQAGVIEAGGGSVRLLRWAEYSLDWKPALDTRLPIWEVLHHLIRTFKHGGDSAAGAVASAIPGKMEAVRQLAYRLYTLCERQGWAEDARGYNELITSWTGIESAASSVPPEQRGLFD